MDLNSYPAPFELQSLTPKVGTTDGNPVRAVEFVATSGLILTARIAVNAPENIPADQRLLDLHPNVIEIPLGKVFCPRFDAPVTRLDVIGYGTVTANGVVNSSADITDVESARQKIDFLFADNVRSLILTMSESWGSGVNARLGIEAFSYD